MSVKNFVRGIYAGALIAEVKQKVEEGSGRFFDLTFVYVDVTIFEIHFDFLDGEHADTK